MESEYCQCGQNKSTHDESEHDAAMGKNKFHPHTVRVTTYAPRRWEPEKKTLWKQIKEMFKR